MTQRSDVEKIKLTLSTPIWNTVIIISKGAEDIWELAKKTFTAELEEGRAKWKGKMRDCKILIEPVSP